jgi:hypothetical protein
VSGKQTLFVDSGASSLIFACTGTRYLLKFNLWTRIRIQKFVDLESRSGSNEKEKEENDGIIVLFVCFFVMEGKKY